MCKNFVCVCVVGVKQSSLCDCFSLERLFSTCLYDLYLSAFESTQNPSTSFKIFYFSIPKCATGREVFAALCPSSFRTFLRAKKSFYSVHVCAAKIDVGTRKNCYYGWILMIDSCAHSNIPPLFLARFYSNFYDDYSDIKSAEISTTDSPKAHAKHLQLN